ncbi:hypothetical protein L1987_57840 [Smallanthus sonchifolius]|uniref:Uncharacterized protein n=1 Tax=Smallanthus sonchifolius TaxID=185202 RepID=A0ACB9DDQ5_9ASTR|nr:hypothetical protein L1987_57840 [Smallanthus sonchifolius]
MLRLEDLDQPLSSSPNFASKNKEEELMSDATSKNQIIDISSDSELDEPEREDELLKEAQLSFNKIPYIRYFLRIPPRRNTNATSSVNNSTTELAALITQQLTAVIPSIVTQINNSGSSSANNGNKNVWAPGQNRRIHSAANPRKVVVQDAANNGGACYGCGATDHLRNNYPKNNTNHAPRARAFSIGMTEAREEPTVVTGTYLLNNHPALCQPSLNLCLKLALLC